MGAEPVQDWQGLAASALEWWRDAGVDTLVEDDARDWLAKPAARAEAVAAAMAVAAAAPAALPDTLEAFTTWRMSNEAPEAEWMTPRMAPTGPADAEWTVVVGMPEPDDAEGLMTGSAGRLLDKMLAAIGLDRESVYLMAVAWARPLAGQVPPEQGAELMKLARHQLSLVAPRKLLLLGQTASGVLDAADAWPPVNRIRDVNHFGGKSMAVASFHPRFLIERPALKSEAWKHLLLLSRGTSQ